MLLISNTLCWSSWKCNCVLHAEFVKKFLGGKNLVTAQTQLCLYSEQQRASNIHNWVLRYLQRVWYVHIWKFSIFWEKQHFAICNALCKNWNIIYVCWATFMSKQMVFMLIIIGLLEYLSNDLGIFIVHLMLSCCWCTFCSYCFFTL